MEPLWVALGDRKSEILFVPNLAEALSAARQLAEVSGRKLVVVTDETVARIVLPTLGGALDDLPMHQLPGGETSKSIASLSKVWEFLAKAQIDRNGIVIALGGGVVGDVAGFASATYLRGIACWQVPTTLLAMVDSSVGGKTGVNLPAGKNLVGAFHQPERVIIATEVLSTLPQREFAAGMAEVIKYGLLGESKLFAGLEREPLTDPKDSELPAIVRRCCAAKARIVQRDERETATEGGRALLNLGHTFAHAIEKVTRYRVYLHGEAVAVGLGGAARLSRRLGLLDDEEVWHLDSVIQRHGLSPRLRAPLPANALHEAMYHDKKVRGGRLRFVVMESLGFAVTRSDISDELVMDVWHELGATSKDNPRQG